MAPAPAPGPMYPIPRTPMSDARRYRSLFSRRRVAPPTPPPPLALLSDDEPSVKTIDPAAELEGDPEEPYLVDHVPIGVPRHTILTLRTGRSKRVPASTPHPLVTIRPAVPLVVFLWGMDLLPAGRLVTLHQMMIW
ncbi:hypothetical protein PIB30_017901 [Stylosanthes scabra]|uniref:Uncharacterized protein n=1 Tax=Stylosanthes scabra TaxID=79078 RepID=A0ABU6Q7J3_9FABA|nr:hypothetical protein [Stylosanthes scabra]